MILANRHVPLALFFSIVTVVSPALLAQNATLTVQGVLKNADGSTVPYGNAYTLTFKLWDAETGGTAVWQETKTNVPILGGLYEIVLGDGATVLNAPFDKPYYLGVSIGTGNGAEFSPRPRLASAPYALSLLGSTNIFPSSGSVGIGTSSPHASAKMEIQSTTKGVLIPRMTKANRDAIANPANGLLIFQTDNSPGFYYYTGSAWKSVNEFANNSPYSIGDSTQGGFIFYLDPSGVHGLIAASLNSIADATTYKWGCEAIALPAARGTAIGSGRANTITIVYDDCASIGGGGVGDIAAERADKITFSNGYTDWHLPSKGELELMHKNLHVAGIGSFGANQYYWSSTENDANTAWRMQFTGSTGTVPDATTKGTLARVRMIRAF
ncbi:MAG: hypothetical protein ABMA02_11130 [Saprospiraceae bacterium]